jgi:hypothetical protein
LKRVLKVESAAAPLARQSVNMSKITFHFKKTVRDELVLTQEEALAFLTKGLNISEAKAEVIVQSLSRYKQIHEIALQADEGDCIDFQEKHEAAESFLENLVDEPPTSHPTDTFNPTLAVKLNDSGDAFEFSLMECVCELIIVDGILIRRKNLDKIKKPNSDIREANLLELLNHELIHEPLPEWSAWMSSELDKKKASK